MGRIPGSTPGSTPVRLPVRLPALLGDAIGWRDLRIGWRLLAREPGYSAVVLGGLAAGFAACFLLLAFVGYCLGYDSAVPQRERIAAVIQRINVFPRPEWENRAYLSLRDNAIASGLVDAASVVKPLSLPLKVGQQLHPLRLDAVDPAFQSVFGIVPLAGDLQAALSRPDGLALTQAAATLLFGAQVGSASALASALGRSVQVGEATLLVRAIVPDRQSNTMLRYQALVGIGSSAWPQATRATDLGPRGRGNVYVKLRPVAPGQATDQRDRLAALLQQAVDDSPQDRQVRNATIGKSLRGQRVTDLRLLPLADLYFDPDLAGSRDRARYGNRGNVFGLAAIALLILLLAAVNYVNLATVRALRRQREIAMRKVLGAGAGRLVRQFLAESVLTTVLAAAAGLLLAWLLLPLFADLVQRPLQGLLTPLRCAAALLFGAATGVVAGLYPAWCARRVRPGTALAGRDNSETQGGLWLRRVLTVLQFGAAMALTGSTLAVGWQTWYASQAWPGFDPAGLLVVDLPDKAIGKPEAAAFAEALARLPGVDRQAGVASMSEAVGRDGMKIINSFTAKDGRTGRLEGKNLSPGWFALHRLQPLHGRLFDPAIDRPDSQVAVVNAEAARELGYASPQDAVGQLAPGGGTIIGVAPTIRYQDMRRAARPVLYTLKPGGVLTLRYTGGDAASAWRAIDPLWQRYFPNQLLEVNTEQSILAALYDEDRRLAQMLALASLVAVLLAGFGIYVLSAYSVQRRRREIVMRKLHGAGRGAIARLVAREFCALVGAGALIGLPLAALANQRYLAGFAERAPVGGWTLGAALLLAALVALLATMRHTLAALRMAPALALREQ